MFILQNVGRQNNDSDCGAFVLQVGSTPVMYLLLHIYSRNVFAFSKVLQQRPSFTLRPSCVNP